MTGLCSGRALAGQDWWTSDNPAEREAAKLICDRCTVATDCLRGALARGEKWGVWAGLDLGVTDMAEPVAEPVAWVRPQVFAPQHGSRAAYIRGCHCPECTAANSGYIADWRERRAWSPPPVVEPQPEQMDLFGEISPVTSSERVMA